MDTGDDSNDESVVLIERGWSCCNRLANWVISKLSLDISVALTVRGEEREDVRDGEVREGEDRLESWWLWLDRNVPL